MTISGDEGTWPIVANVFLMISHVVIGSMVKRELETASPQKWQELYGSAEGKPRSPEEQESSINSFIWSRKYRLLGSTRLTRLGDLCLANDLLIILVMIYWAYGMYARHS